LSLVDSIIAAEKRIAGIVRETPLDRSPLLSQRTKAEVFLKLEQLQHTGSFKLRGAAAKLTTLAPDVRARGVITASTGNHGLAVIHASRATGAAPPTVLVPTSADPAKVERLKQYGAEVVVSGETCTASEIEARALAEKAGRSFVSPYNDIDVVAGQGTLGLEIARNLDAIDTVYVAVGGGGLVSGLGTAIKAAQPQTRVIGCLPANSQGMLASIRAGRIVEAAELPTLSDATAGGVEPGAITFALCQKVVDDWITVTEDEIAAAWRALFAADRWVVEGAAAVAVAGVLKAASTGASAGGRAIVVLCGRNVSASVISSMGAC
jgi:threonine dehydratase